MSKMSKQPKIRSITVTTAFIPWIENDPDRKSWMIQNTSSITINARAFDNGSSFTIPAGATLESEVGADSPQYEVFLQAASSATAEIWECFKK